MIRRRDARELRGLPLALLERGRLEAVRVEHPGEAAEGLADVGGLGALGEAEERQGVIAGRGGWTVTRGPERGGSRSSSLAAALRPPEKVLAP